MPEPQPVLQFKQKIHATAKGTADGAAARDAAATTVENI